MHDVLQFFGYLLIMAGVTYLVRMLPLVFFRKKIESRFVKSFLHYIPYAVLTVMTVPAILSSTGYLSSAILGTLVAVLLSFFGRSLITVAAGSALAVLLVELLVPYVSFLAF